MSEQEKRSPLLKEEPKPVEQPAEPEHYSVKVSVTDPEMAMLPGGVFVMSLPMNSKGVNRIIAMGWAVTAVFRLNDIFTDFERLKKEHAARIKKGDLSLLSKIKCGFSELMK